MERVSKLKKDILEMIEERQLVLLEIERVLFTSRYNLSKRHLGIFSIQSISMIYSIWEGFMQQAFKRYIHYINSLDLNVESISDDLRIFLMECSFKQLFNYPSKKTKKIDYYDKLKDHLSKEKCDIPAIIETNSNLGFDELNKIMCLFSLTTFPEHWDNYKYPNPNLKEVMYTFLRYRNSIAHGGDISSEEKVTIDVYNKYRKLVGDLMFEILSKISFGIENETYIKR